MSPVWKPLKSHKLHDTNQENTFTPDTVDSYTPGRM